MIYTRMFLQTLKRKSLAKLEQFPGLYDRETMLGSRDLYAFDNVVTAPLHGFRDTDDYWARASSKPILGEIRIPTLVLNARNDPFPPAGICRAHARSAPTCCWNSPSTAATSAS
jgi:predicted alpha/beta-fold hydrolase